MSVIPPENTDRLEHQRQHDAELRHDKEMLEHREHADEKGQIRDELASASPSEPSSDTPEYMTKTVWTPKTFIAAVALSGLYVGSQIPLYFVGGSLSFIAADIGGAEASAWLAVSYALALSAVAPFCGYLQDLVGRRNITLGGGVSLMMGCIVLATAHTFGQGVVGMSFAGAGAAIGELTALAGFVCSSPGISLNLTILIQDFRTRPCQQERHISRTRHTLRTTFHTLPFVCSALINISHLAVGYLDLLVSPRTII